MTEAANENRMKCVQLLEDAATAVGGDRNTTHGNKRDNFQSTADFWSTYLGKQLNSPITPDQVALMMVLLKVSRTACGTKIDDHYMDMCGYAAIAGEVR